VLMKRGTWMDAPVSSTAILLPPPAQSRTHARAHTAMYEHQMRAQVHPTGSIIHAQVLYEVNHCMPALCTRHLTNICVMQSELLDIPMQACPHTASVTPHWCGQWPASHAAIAQDEGKACIYAPLAVLPLTPGGASVTSRSTKLGGSTLITCGATGGA
jgi:hypothetical protein